MEQAARFSLNYSKMFLSGLDTLGLVNAESHPLYTRDYFGDRDYAESLPKTSEHPRVGLILWSKINP
jgi:hypothetical protein